MLTAPLPQTCSEMALATSIIAGDKNEWALTKRHQSEQTFVSKRLAGDLY